MKTVICSSLQKVFSDAPVLPQENAVLRLFSGEKGSLQLCFNTPVASTVTVEVTSDLPCKIWEVREMYSALPIYPDAENCTVLRGGPGYFPDLLAPFGGTLKTEAGKNTALWIEADAAGAKAGEYTLAFDIKRGAVALRREAKIYVNGVNLRPQKLVHTDWFHSDCLSVYYNVPVFGEEYWRIVENYMRNAADHGVNCILTPLFTPALDTEVGGERPTVQLVRVRETDDGWNFDFTLLEKWIALAERCGVGYFEFSHLFTQWGALAAPKIVADTPDGEKRIFGWETDSLSPAYRAFLEQLGAALTAFTDEKGITDRCYVHCSDEPGGDQLERYEKCADLVHTFFGKYKHIDALSDYEYYENGLVPYPVPSENSIAPFVGRVPELWTYYCCGQFNNEVPNRFFSMPSVRNRILGVLLYRYDIAGFLHWGYNFYFSQLSKRAVDPFAVTDADAAFPSGDAFVVYPGEDGEPMPSLRQKVFFDGLQDLRALQTAEETLGREAVLELIKDTLGEIDFSHYPMDEDTFFRFRERVWKSVEGKQSER
ncbi:MAG: DUF4091 domain-containing protein [Clostridia bacterium]|nr:DUF4091 domain-containing protein [Clostridia bacterium]